MAGDVEQLGTSVERVRALKKDATQRLLGATIAISDLDWQQPSLLPGWTRAHVATHIARNADALCRLAGNVLTGGHDPMYPLDRCEEIERGSERSALDLQIDLDTTAGRLNDILDRVARAQWGEEVELHDGRRQPLRMLPVGRLGEVELHHVDLGVGYTVDAIKPEVAELLLRFYAQRAIRQGQPPVRLRADDGLVVDVGRSPDRTVHGSRTALLGWLTGRPSAQPVTGADDTERLPL